MPTDPIASFRSPDTIALAAEAIAADFSLLMDWEDRYTHIMSLGRAMETGDDALESTHRNDSHRVEGCVSQVWMTCRPLADGRLVFRGASDALLVSGLIAVLMALYSRRHPADILAFDAASFFALTGIDRALTAQRSNGLAAMHGRILTFAQVAAGAQKTCPHAASIEN